MSAGAEDAGRGIEHRFMHAQLGRLLREGRLRPSDRVLVTCAGPLDAQVLDDLGLREAVFTGLGDGGPIARWERADAEDLPYPDASFDVAIVHAGLHHCRSPHRGLTEMLRVARRMVLVFESQDSLVLRLLVRAGLSTEYELDAVSRNAWARGGVRDGPVPNFVYRWTRREVEKLVRAWMPEREVPVEFASEFAFHEWNLGGRLGGHPLVRALGPDLAPRVFRLGMRVLNAVLARQGNLFMACIDVGSARLQPWMEAGDDGPRMRRT